MDREQETALQHTCQWMESNELLMHRVNPPARSSERVYAHWLQSSPHASAVHTKVNAD
jgi:hypothetical protein